MPHAYTDLPWVFWVSAEVGPGPWRAWDLGEMAPAHLVYMLLDWQSITGEVERRELAW